MSPDSDVLPQPPAFADLDPGLDPDLAPGADLAPLLAEFNAAVRRPETSGGAAAIAGLLDRLAAADPACPDGIRWIPDGYIRFAPSSLLRESFPPETELPLVASQYGEDAHYRGWLRADRELDPEEHGRLVGRAVRWSWVDRRLEEVVAEFGTPSVVYGDPDPRHPKTLAYLSSDPAAPVAAFHFGPDGVLFAVRVNEDLFHGWSLTPAGELPSA